MIGQALMEDMTAITSERAFCAPHACDPKQREERKQPGFIANMQNGFVQGCIGTLTKQNGGKKLQGVVSFEKSENAVPDKSLSEQNSERRLPDLSRINFGKERQADMQLGR